MCAWPKDMLGKVMYLGLAQDECLAREFYGSCVQHVENHSCKKKKKNVC